ncbi:MAG: macro domain-containing protein [Roseiflexaceae bacterium]
MPIETLSGDLLDQPIEAIVNAWNRNLIPWWLLRPHGVSGAIKRHAGVEPFRELARYGPLALGQAVLTGAGRLPFRAIIHVAAITLWGRSSDEIIRAAVRNALALARDQAFASLAFPVLGSGSGGVHEQQALESMLAALGEQDYAGRVLIVRYRRRLRRRLWRSS